MEAALLKSDHKVLEKDDSRPVESCKEHIVLKDDDEVAKAKAQMTEVREENQRLRMCIDRIMKDHKMLQTQLHDMINAKQEEIEKPTYHTNYSSNNYQETEDPGLVSLRLGRALSDKKRDENIQILSENEEREGLALPVLDCKVQEPRVLSTSLERGLEQQVMKEEADRGESWSADKKAPKTMRSTGDHDAVSQESPAKKARVSVKVRCDGQTINDGCQWRKYGQKVSKGNPCPRAYYRCIISPSCPVRKQVQRCAEDMSVLITTYEGAHNHPLPGSATAMASTTSAAVSMLTCGSSSSCSRPGPTHSSSPDNDHHLRGPNLSLMHNSKFKHFDQPIYSISSLHNSHPTITLDLTSTSWSSTSHSSKIRSNFPPRYYSTSALNFSCLESNPLPVSWGSGVLNYASTTTTQQYYYNKSQIDSLNLGGQSHENLHQPHIEKNNNRHPPPPGQHPLPPDTVAAAAKVIASDPSFQSALAAALTSIVGGGDKSGQNVKSDHIINFPSTSGAKYKCPPTYDQSRPHSATTLSDQPRSLMFLQPSLQPFSTSNTKSLTPGDHDSRDHTI